MTNPWGTEVGHSVLPMFMEKADQGGDSQKQWGEAPSNNKAPAAVDGSSVG